MKPLKFGIVGLGNMGTQHYHSITQQFVQRAEVTAVCDVDPARLSKLSPEIPRFSDSLEMIESGLIEALVIATPHYDHSTIGEAALKRGLHLLVEKPLCVSSQEAETILQKAKSAKVMVQVGHIEHYNPVMTFLEGEVKEPRYLTVERLAPFQPRGTEVGVVLDLMIHDVGIAMALVDSPIERIDSIGVRVLSPTEDIANARLVFANGCVANLSASRVSEKKAREIRVFQDTGYLSLDFMNQKGHLIKKSGPSLERHEVPVEQGEPLALELASFLSCVQDATTPKTDGSFGKSALEVALTITRQIQSAWNLE